MLRTNILRVGALVLLATLVLAACAPYGNSNSSAPSGSAAPAPTTGAIVAPTTAPAASAPATVPTTSAPAQAPAVPPVASGSETISVARDEKLGHFLTDGNKRTLYVFMKDTNNTSNCSDACAKNWPPLTVAGQPTAMQGLDDTLIGTLKRSDGTTQVTFNGHPLYYFGGDKNQGDTKGQGVGGNWFVIDFNGDPVQDSNTPSAAPTTASPSSAPTRSY